MTRSSLIAAFQLSLRAALASGIAVALAQLLGLQYPLYAMIGAVIVTDLSPSRTRQLGVRRLAGTLLGAGVGAALSYVLPDGPLAIGLSILVSMFLSHLLQLDGAAKITGYVCAIVVLSHGDRPWAYALSRLIETALGVGVALLVSFVPKLLRVEDSK